MLLLSTHSLDIDTQIFTGQHHVVKLNMRSIAKFSMCLFNKGLSANVKKILSKKVLSA
jgi:hypothetical protein